eukprot:jgi/Orpsp1_1/1177418/evm.model.c7180000061385.1
MHGQPPPPQMPNPYGQPYAPPLGGGPNMYGQPQVMQDQSMYAQPPPPATENTTVDISNIEIEKKNENSNLYSEGGAGDYKGSKIKFEEKPKYQDVWATVIYVFTVIMTIGIAAVSIPNMDVNDMYGSNNNSTTTTSSSSSSSSSSTSSSSSSSSSTGYKTNSTKYKRSADGSSNADIFVMLIASVVSAGLMAFIYMVLMQRYAGKMIKGTLIMSIVLNLIYAVICILIHPIVGGIMLLFALLYCLCWWFWKKRIPFAKVMLKTVVSVTRKFPATILTGFIGCFVAGVWYIFISITIVASMCYFGNQNEDTGTVSFVIYIFLAFSFYFSSQVINNTVHVTISGVFATYYFRGTVEPGTKEITVAEKNPTAKSFKRAITTSFGSICFGSLIIAIIDTLKLLARMAKENAGEDDNVALQIIACCIECILNMIGDIIEYFNVYAFTEVAIYGKSYCKAAKDTWTLCKAHGIEALINDNLIGNVLTLGAISVGCLSTVITVGIGFLIMQIRNVAALIIYGIIAFLIGMMIFSVISQVINSGVATTFVCICEDIDALRNTKPELYDKVRETYPS